MRDRVAGVRRGALRGWRARALERDDRDGRSALRLRRFRTTSDRATLFDRRRWHPGDGSGPAIRRRGRHPAGQGRRREVPWCVGDQGPRGGPAEGARRHAEPVRAPADGVSQGETIYRADSMEACVAFAEAQPRPAPGQSGRFVCRGNLFPTAAFYLGSYYNEVGQPDQALAGALNLGPDRRAELADPARRTQRRHDNSARTVGRMSLAGADRGLAIEALSPTDHALMLRNRGYAAYRTEATRTRRRRRTRRR